MKERKLQDDRSVKRKKSSPSETPPPEDARADNGSEPDPGIPRASRAGPFGLLNTAVNSFVRFITSPIGRRTRARSLAAARASTLGVEANVYTEPSIGPSEASAEVSNDAMPNTAIVDAIYETPTISTGEASTEVRTEAPQLNISQDTAQTASDTPQNAEVEDTETVRPELRHTLSLIFTHLLTEANSRLGQSETEGAQDRVGGEEMQEFEVLLHAVPLQRTNSTHNIIFTIIYQMAEESPRPKAVDIRVLNEAVPEEKTERAEGECSICLEPIEAGVMLRRLKCLHFFHSQCVTEWLTKHTNECPMCRMVAVENLEDTVSG